MADGADDPSVHWVEPRLRAILPLDGISTRLLGALDDSKRLSAEVRETVAAKLRVKAIWALGEASVEEIDRFNILRATFLAMRRAFAVSPLSRNSFIRSSRAPADSWPRGASRRYVWSHSTAEDRLCSTSNASRAR